jgi:hypothetical protein
MNRSAPMTRGSRPAWNIAVTVSACLSTQPIGQINLAATEFDDGHLDCRASTAISSSSLRSRDKGELQK